MAVVSECTIKRLGILPFDFNGGTCGTFLINSLPTILLCFDWNGSKCRSLTRKTDGALSEIKDFDFETEFEIDGVPVPDSTYDHYRATMANYQGFPLILGGWTEGNNKLEMLNTIENPPRWVEGTDYSYSNT